MQTIQNANHPLGFLSGRSEQQPSIQGKPYHRNGVSALQRGTEQQPKKLISSFVLNLSASQRLSPTAGRGGQRLPYRHCSPMPSPTRHATRAPRRRALIKWPALISGARIATNWQGWVCLFHLCVPVGGKGALPTSGEPPPSLAPSPPPRANPSVAPGWSSSSR